MTAVYIIFIALLKTAFALDLTGCAPRQPAVIDTITRLHGDIYSPGYTEGINYPDDLYCQYTIRAPVNFRIRLIFADLDIEAFDLCQQDALEVYEGLNPRNPIHGVYCGNGTYPDLVSNANALHIVFRSDFMVGRKGFHLKYQTEGVSARCNYFEMPCRNQKCFETSKRCDGNDDCGDGTDEENCGYPFPVTVCGKRFFSSFPDADRVIGGREAATGSWPWQADLQLSFFHPNGHMCGGTLINSQWVLTAAHCFTHNRTPVEWRVHLGKHHKFFNDKNEQVRFVERIIVYPEITGKQLIDGEIPDMTNDIALMKLNAPVKYTNYVRPACLPPQGFNLAPGSKCMGTGWGTTRGSGSSHVLKEVDLWIEMAQSCHGDIGPMNNKTMICVSNRKGLQDVCHGDSGGPLVCEINGVWQLLGATSHGTRTNLEGGLCAMREARTVYAKVADKINWIQNILNKYG